MNDFDYVRPADVMATIQAGRAAQTRFLAGGTTLIDLMKLHVERPVHLVDINRLEGLDGIDLGDAAIQIGALARMSQVADDAGIAETAPVLSQSLWRAASAQIRNMASIGGNLMQRTRCTYFRDPGAYPNCNKRSPGSGCAALDGINRNHAVLGTSDACIAIYPGDFAVALVAFDAQVRIRGMRERSVPIDAFYRVPGETPHIEHDLAPGELIVGIELPRSAALRRSHYLKVRDRASYEFAAASAAVGLDLESDGRTIRDVRVALGGVATKPWRAREAEAVLKDQSLNQQTAARAAEAAFAGAVSHGQNDYKLELGRRTLVRALLAASAV